MEVPLAALYAWLMEFHDIPPLTEIIRLKTMEDGDVIDLTYVVSEPKGGKGFNLFIRFTQGFIDIVKENTGDRFTNSTIQFGAAFPFVESSDQKN